MKEKLDKLYTHQNEKNEDSRVYVSAISIGGRVSRTLDVVWPTSMRTTNPKQSRPPIATATPSPPRAISSPTSGVCNPNDDYPGEQYSATTSDSMVNQQQIHPQSSKSTTPTPQPEHRIGSSKCRQSHA